MGIWSTIKSKLGMEKKALLSRSSRDRINPSWRMLRGFGSSRVVQSSYIWLIVVPMAAKVLSGMHGKTIVLFGQIEIVMTLPFSWQLFFFASLAFSIATTLFLFGCPQIIRDFEDYSEFYDMSRSGSLLIRAMNLLNVYSHWCPDDGLGFWDYAFRFARVEGEFMDLHELKRDNMDEHETRNLHAKIISRGTIAEKELPEALDVAMTSLRYASPRIRFGCTLFYGVGMLLLLVILYENVKTVLTLIAS